MTTKREWKPVPPTERELKRVLQPACARCALEAWEARCAQALTVPAIRAGFELGWAATDRDLTSTADEPALPEVQL